jgi:hypothetical protein
MPRPSFDVLSTADQISTKTVNKLVEKHPLDMPKASADAGFNNLPAACAHPGRHEINV